MPVADEPELVELDVDEFVPDEDPVVLVPDVEPLESVVVVVVVVVGELGEWWRGGLVTSRGTVRPVTVMLLTVRVPLGAIGRTAAA